MTAVIAAVTAREKGAPLSKPKETKSLQDLHQVGYDSFFCSAACVRQRRDSSGKFFINAVGHVNASDDRVIFLGAAEVSRSDLGKACYAEALSGE